MEFAMIFMALAAALAFMPRLTGDAPHGGAPPAEPQPPPPVPSPAAPGVTAPGAAVPSPNVNQAVNTPIPPPDVAMDTVFDYTGSKGDTNATMADLIKAHDALANLPAGVSLEDVNALAAAIAGDPAAQRQVYSQVMEKLPGGANAAPTTVTPEMFTQAMDKIGHLETELQRANRVTEKVETLEFHNTVKALLAQPKIKEAFPWLTADANAGVPLAAGNLRNLMKACEAAPGNVQPTQQQILAQLAAANNHIQSVAGAFGVTVPTPAALAPVANADPTGRPQPGTVTSPGAPLGMLPGATGAATTVPGAGGVPGSGTPTITPTEGGPFNKNALRERIKAQRAARQGVQQ